MFIDFCGSQYSGAFLFDSWTIRQCLTLFSSIACTLRRLSGSDEYWRSKLSSGGATFEVYILLSFASVVIRGTRFLKVLCTGDRAGLVIYAKASVWSRSRVAGLIT
uniref:Uncharacterized protein n=1 Tax=Tetraselmis chuii TaxID=63592 RepID=A0A6U1ISC7_9CHLO|mmetsp:Transcript_32485/g.58113  ORF Transcript_32485/g.58113 Transcript_32485/m.58113 type:complete len:106 (+) Transcript_32485:1058-1375(+)